MTEYLDLADKLQSAVGTMTQNSGIMWDGGVAIRRLLDENKELREQLADKLKLADLYTTADGVQVRPGSRVWVRGSGDWKETTVLRPVTSYMYFNNIEVSNSYAEKPI